MDSHSDGCIANLLKVLYHRKVKIEPLEDNTRYSTDTRRGHGSYQNALKTSHFISQLGFHNTFK